MVKSFTTKLFLLLLLPLLAYQVSAACAITAIADQSTQVGEAWAGVTADANGCENGTTWLLTDADGSGLTIVNATRVITDDATPVYSEKGDYDIVLFFGNATDNDTETFVYSVTAYTASDVSEVAIDNLVGVGAALFGFVSLIGIALVYRYGKKK